MKFDLDRERILLEKDGNTIDCDVLFTFDSPDTLKSYVGYTDHSVAGNGRKNVYVSSFDPFQAEMKLEDIKDPKELEMINEVLIQLDNKVNE